MRVIKKKIAFDINTLLTEELPYTRAFYHKETELHTDIASLFDFFNKNKHAMPMYTIRESSCDAMQTVFNSTYDMMLEALTVLFNQEPEKINTFFNCETLRKHPYFVDYAKYTFNSKNRSSYAIYGRFDAAFDPIKEKVVGIYEFNGDTPVMLFESTHIQNRITKQITGEFEAQYNSYYVEMLENIKTSALKNMNVAIVCNPNYIEDIITCETLAQIVESNNTCLFASLNELDYDYAQKENPFVINNHYLDSLFVLVPWEDMVDSFPTAFKEWRNWAHNVNFMEPAWRWFLSHKGIWAYITHLMETNITFKVKHQHLPLLRTYLTNDVFIKEQKAFVSKPVIGRMSANITVHDKTGYSEFKSEGPYPDCEKVYQEFCAPFQVEDRNNFIIGMFMSPTYHGLKANASTFCIREFESPVLGTANERFIPHLIKYDDIENNSFLKDKI